MDTLTTLALGFVAFMFILRQYFKSTWGRFDEDVDMTGKTAIITGANSGIGKALAVEFAKRNARVILACRSILRGEGARMDIVADADCAESNVVLKILDLSSLDSVRKFANQVVNSEERLDILVNNAGVMGSPVTQTKDGIELTYQTNHFGHFLLTNLLLDLLKRTGSCARIINISSFMHKYADLDLDYLKPDDVKVYLETRQKSTFQTKAQGFLYNNSKLMNVMFTAELARRLEGCGVTAYSVNPGIVRTNLLSDDRRMIVLFALLLMLINSKTIEEGCQTPLYCSLSRSLCNMSGKYFSECKEDPNVHELVQNNESCQKLWRLSEEITGIASKS